ncbi:formin-J-like [Triplophysa rosa]|nr:formin-J-like [Triplophysa rosa]
MLKTWIILAAASCAVSAVYTSRKQINHGDYLSLDLPERTDKLEFASADEETRITIWKQQIISPSKASKGTVYSSSDGWTFQLRHITFDDEGTYTLFNSWNTIISTYTVKVNTKRNMIECIPGETLSISLEGIKPVDATLRFHSNHSVVTLVENGNPVGNADPNYINRLKVTSERIKVLNVNVSDVGRYQLTDHKSRLVSNNTMILVDQHNFTPNKSLIALILLGIPGSICFCCRKRICKRCRNNKSQTDNDNTLNPLPESVPICHPVTDPSQGYTAGYPTLPDQGQNHFPPPNQGQTQYPPPDPSQIQYPPPPQWSGQPAVHPNPSFNPEYAPQNPVYPPGPVGPPAQPPQWNVSPNQYNPPAPVNYNPLMNSAPSGPQPTTYNITYNDSSTAASLLAPQPESDAPRVSVDVLNSSDSAGVHFDIDKGKSSTSNFL